MLMYGLTLSSNHHDILSALGKLCSNSNGTNQLLMTQKTINVKLWCNPLCYISATSQWTSHFAMYGSNQHAMRKLMWKQTLHPTKSTCLSHYHCIQLHYIHVLKRPLICFLGLGFNLHLYTRMLHKPTESCRPLL